MSTNNTAAPADNTDSEQLDSIDRQLIEVTQQGLPLDLNPYQVIADELWLEEDEVIERLQKMMDRGLIRRIGLVPNHYRLGYKFNAMTVWDVPDDKVTELGQQVGAMDFVSHSYERPRHLPLWRYNLFAMVHGRSEAEVEQKVAQLRELLKEHLRDGKRLDSKRILKKTGMRIKRAV